MGRREEFKSRRKLAAGKEIHGRFERAHELVKNNSHFKDPILSSLVISVLRTILVHASMIARIPISALSTWNVLSLTQRPSCLLASRP